MCRQWGRGQKLNDDASGAAANGAAANDAAANGAPVEKDSASLVNDSTGQNPTPAQLSERQLAEGNNNGGAVAVSGSGSGGGGNAKKKARMYTDGVDAYFTAESDSHEVVSQDDKDQPAAEEYQWITSRGQVRDMRTMNLTALKTSVHDDLMSTLYAEEKRVEMRDSGIMADIEGLHSTEALTFDGTGGEVAVQQAVEAVFKLFKDYENNGPALEAMMSVMSKIAVGYIDQPRKLKAAEQRVGLLIQLIKDKEEEQDKKKKAKEDKEKNARLQAVALSAKRKLDGDGDRRSSKKALMFK